MQRFTYDCDGGSIAIGTSKCRVCLPNEYGDGEFNVFITEKDEKPDMLGGVTTDSNNWSFLGCAEGDEINVYNYDCLNTEEQLKNGVLITLSGRYGIRCMKNDGDIWLEKWA